VTDVQSLTLEAGDGTPLPITELAAPDAFAGLLFLPALGVRAELYREFAGQLAQAGVCCWLLEQRGHGDSPLRASSTHRWRFDDLIDQDIAAAVRALRERIGDVPLVLGGHSLGGHLATVFAGRQPRAIDALLHVACGFPYHADYAARQAKMVLRLCRLIPLFNAFPGYYPGHRIGFGGRESLGMMSNWCEWARSGSFNFGPHHDVAEQIGRFSGAVLSIDLDGDSLVTRASLDRGLSALTAATITRVTLGAAEQGDYRGHATWAKAPEGVVAATRTWLQDALGVRR
jgi:predicted alpha/beta hydrolase